MYFITDAFEKLFCNKKNKSKSTTTSTSATQTKEMKLFELKNLNFDNDYKNMKSVIFDSELANCRKNKWESFMSDNYDKNCECGWDFLDDDNKTKKDDSSFSFISFQEYNSEPRLTLKDAVNNEEKINDGPSIDEIKLPEWPGLYIVRPQDIPEYPIDEWTSGNL